MKVTILRGVSGSGKSTYAKTWLTERRVFSADHFFTDNGGKYNFDGRKLPQAHGACLRAYVEYLQRANSNGDIEFPDVVVDNTNTTIAEIAPYVAIAQAYGAEVDILTIKADPVVAAQRNTHGVDQSAVDRQNKHLHNETSRMPAWWKHTEI